MSDRNQNRFSLTTLAVIAGIVLAAGGSVAWWAKSSLEQKSQVTQPNPAPIISEKVPPVPEAITEEKVVEICWLDPTSKNIKLVHNKMTFAKSVKSERVLETALSALFNQPPEDSTYTTAIPQGTKLLNLTSDKSGVHLDLSQEFISGGGSASMTSRLAQVIFTATSSNSNNQVWISVEGKPLKNLGQEGIIVSQPMTRQDFNDNFPL
ncbi:MAG: GerMN domain-containing protein [Cyanobacteria bacterium J06621_8]